MIIIKSKEISPKERERLQDDNRLKKQMIETMENSNNRYKFDDIQELEFELNMRVEIIKESFVLNNSDLTFESFSDTRCNIEYWIKDEIGGFQLRQDVLPSDAIQDIFINSNKYDTECATAIMIIYYKALLNLFGEEKFNHIFSNIYLMGWNIEEPLLIEVANPIKVEDKILGDRQYFSNPDVKEETLEWQGENVILVDNDRYYGHGIGIKTEEEMIESLNTYRKEESIEPAYLNEIVARPDFKKIAQLYLDKPKKQKVIVWNDFPEPICKK